MASILRFLIAILVFLRPIAGCCECHAPLLQGVQLAIELLHDDVYAHSGCDCCDHESQPPNHTPGSCGSCESTQDFVKVVAPQVEQAPPAVCWLPMPSSCDMSCGHMQNPAGTLGQPDPGGALRAHLVLGVLLI
jgi:hypothetical protein